MTVTKIHKQKSNELEDIRYGTIPFLPNDFHFEAENGGGSAACVLKETGKKMNQVQFYNFNKFGKILAV